MLLLKLFKGKIVVILNGFVTIQSDRWPKFTANLKRLRAYVSGKLPSSVFRLKSGTTEQLHGFLI